MGRRRKCHFRRREECKPRAWLSKHAESDEVSVVFNCAIRDESLSRISRRLVRHPVFPDVHLVCHSGDCSDYCVWSQPSTSCVSSDGQALPNCPPSCHHLMNLSAPKVIWNEAVCRYPGCLHSYVRKHLKMEFLEDCSDEQAVKSHTMWAMERPWMPSTV